MCNENADTAGLDTSNRFKTYPVFSVYKMRQIQRCGTGHYPVMKDYKNEWFIAVDCSFLGYVSKLEIKYKTEKPAP